MSDPIKIIEGLLTILEGESGAGANYWEQDERYVRAREYYENVKAFGSDFEVCESCHIGLAAIDAHLDSEGVALCATCKKSAVGE